MTTALRSFLQYARYLGEVTLDLAAAVPIVANWSMTSIPRGISTEHVHQLLASIDRRTAVGRRDYAILLMLARLGLRVGEVVSLELGDIDWNLGQVNVHGKSGQRNRLPLRVCQVICVNDLGFVVGVEPGLMLVQSSVTRRRRGCGNVEIPRLLRDFQARWERWKSRGRTFPRVPPRVISTAKLFPGSCGEPVFVGC
jgi:hypothetical protein